MKAPWEIFSHLFSVSTFLWTRNVENFGPHIVYNSYFYFPFNFKDEKYMNYIWKKPWALLTSKDGLLAQLYFRENKAQCRKNQTFSLGSET